jgi:hypothetical protein
VIIRKFSTPLKAWRGLINELAYDHKSIATEGKGGITTSFSDGVVVEIKDILSGDDLHLDQCSFGRPRFTQFLKRYLRPDFGKWVDDTSSGLAALNKHQVASYSINLNPLFEEVGRKGYGSSSKGHRWGACLSSISIQHFPKPKVILISRASQLDKAGFLDLSLMHLTAKRTGWEKVSGTWIISMAFIAAVQQLYFVRRFNEKKDVDKALKGHSLEKSVRRFWHDNPDKDAHYGPQKRAIRRAIEFQKKGTISRSCAVSELSLDF